MRVRALIFDVDGTLAETEEIHRAAFNQAFAEAGLGWLWTRELYARLLRITGGRERMTAYAAETGARPLDFAGLHRRKTDIFNAMLRRGPIALRPGVADLIRAGRENGLRLAIATTTSRPNVGSLIAATLGEDALGWFVSIRTGEDVARKKPDPEVYRLALADLALRPSECLAFEDSANGLRAALAAGIPTVITPSLYTMAEDFTGATWIAEDLTALAAACAADGAGFGNLLMANGHPLDIGEAAAV
jgi:beta-phosphoglucomutase-like phosphatase (HAD superfamily)